MDLSTHRKSRFVKGAAPIAERVAEPFDVAQVLRNTGLEHARHVAAVAASRQRADALSGGLPAPIDPEISPPDQRLIDRLGEDVCLRRRVLPWRESSGTVTVLVSDPEDFLKCRDMLTILYGKVAMGMTTDDGLDAALTRHCGRSLQDLAETRTAPGESCRNWDAAKARNFGLAALALVAAAFILWPAATFVAFSGWAIFTLLANTALKIAAAVIYLRADKQRPMAVQPENEKLPTVTVLVPLFKERDIAKDLLRRLRRLHYPREKLDICLVTEASDTTTQQALRHTELPPWIRAVNVPSGTLQTKPRALNYALTFARGSIIGVYDAEDAPDPNQLRKVAARFASCGPEVACLQGRLDFYNTDTNWLSRCFTVEYATWFRVILPGLQRMGLPIPLGGTTLFFRRDILEDLGGWDAHNVTEDADLGIRLTRHGYRTEVIETVTEEEANCRPWPWVKQRSRWLKGYAITYVVHMRNPRRLWQELGPKGFFGVQLIFVGTLSQFILAPLLWSFWLVALGFAHPVTTILSQPVALGLALSFLGTELIGIAIAAIAVRAAGKPELIKWIPSLHLYFPLAAMAAYKGVIELAFRPFYWDKTAHGIFSPTRAKQRTVTKLPPLRRPVAGE